MAPQFGFSMGSSRRGGEKVCLSLDRTIYPLMNATEEQNKYSSELGDQLFIGLPALCWLACARVRLVRQL